MGNLDLKIVHLQDPVTGLPVVWSAGQLLSYYRSSPAGFEHLSAPLNIDADWYMSANGPGRFYSPSSFPVIQKLLSGSVQLEPGQTYDLVAVTVHLTIPVASGVGKSGHGV